MQRKQLKQLSQCKVVARITQEEEAQRASKAGVVVLGSGILGYGKGKAPEKCVSGMRGAEVSSRLLFFFF